MNKLLWSGLAVAVFVLVFCGCEPVEEAPAHHSAPSKSRAQLAVESMGFADVRMGGAPLWGCSKEDSVITSAKFTAKNARGQTVSGYACCGLWLRGCTVRVQ